MSVDTLLTEVDTRAALRACLATWPVIDDATAQFLRSLHWRVRQAVILVHGQRLTGHAAAFRLGISVRTLYHDLAVADAQYQAASQPVLSVTEETRLCDTGIRGLAAAVILQAWQDALSGGAEALSAQEWLRSHPWAETLCEAVEVDRRRLVVMMEAAPAK